jgi:hypothetical protein
VVTFTTGHANNREIIPSVTRRIVTGFNAVKSGDLRISDRP